MGKILLAGASVVMDPGGADLILGPHFESLTLPLGRETIEISGLADLARRSELGMWDFRDVQLNGKRDGDPALYQTQLRTWMQDGSEVYLNFRADGSKPAAANNLEYRVKVQVSDPGGIGGSVGEFEAIQVKLLGSWVQYSSDTTNGVDGAWDDWAKVA